MSATELPLLPSPPFARSAPMRSYSRAAESDEVLRGALVLADLKAHDNRAPPKNFYAADLDVDELTERRVIAALVLEAERWQSLSPPLPTGALLHSLPHCALLECRNTHPLAAPASGALLRAT